MNLTFGAEPELLLLCARTWITGEAAARISMLLEREIDWDQLLAWGQTHGVNVLLFRALAGVQAGRVPLRILDTLRARCEAIRLGNLVLARELHRAMGVLQRSGITATPYKGPALSVLLYQDIGIREFTDIDILIRPRDAQAARQVLIEHGFVPRKRLSPRIERWYARFHCTFSFAVLQGRTVLEVNWRIAPWYWRLPEVPQDAWSRLSPLTVAGREVPCLSPEDTLFVLCVHGCKHRWESLKWIVDVAELLRRPVGLDWARLLRNARDARCERIIALGLLLATELLDAPVPGNILATLRGSPVTGRLAAQVADSLFVFSRSPADTLDELPFVARAAERYGTKLSCYSLVPGYLLIHRVVRPGLTQLRRRRLIGPAA